MSQWQEFWQFYWGSTLFLATVAIACTSYVVMHRDKLGEWAMACAGGAALLIHGISIYNGTRVLRHQFELIAVSGGGGTGVIASSLAVSRIPILIGTGVSVAVIVLAVTLFWISREEDPYAEPGSRRTTPVIVMFCGIGVATLLLIMDYRLPNYVLNASVGLLGVHVSKGTVSQTIAAWMLLLTVFSGIAILIGAALLFAPLVLKVSRAPLFGIEYYVSAGALLVLFFAQLAVVSSQVGRLNHIAITGVVPGAPPREVLEKGRSEAPDNPVSEDLFQPIREGNRKLVQALIAKGVDVNGQSVLGTPLMVAIDARNNDIVQDLLEAGADINTPNSHGTTPLMQAILSNNVTMVPILIGAGASIDARDENGSTALMHAATMGSLEAVNALLEHKADPNSRDHYGITVLQVAQASGKTEIVDALKNAGATN